MRALQRGPALQPPPAAHILGLTYARLDAEQSRCQTASRAGNHYKLMPDRARSPQKRPQTSRCLTSASSSHHQPYPP
jgi:hypothetical protein